jgi:queuine tRNA-ribosyltransferase
MFEFRVLAQDPDTGARAGEFVTPHGAAPTPLFMPCATQGTVKTLTPAHLEEIGVEMLLANAYHLGLRPGVELVAQMGGIHRFMSWSKPILTDSGGFQIFSMADLRTISEGGVLFRSHLDGAEVFLTPERCIEIENRIGADVIMPLDECAPFPSEKAPARAAMERTIGWAARCKAAHRREDQALFGIVQGATYPDLRRECADRLAALDFPGHAIGGLSVGEGLDLMVEITAGTIERLPPAKPRYLMGVGRPEDIVACVAQGVDLFDCVLPTRCGRNGLAFTTRGRVKVRHAAHRADERPLDPLCDCLACRRFSRAYLRHLFHAGEMLGLTLLSLHNLRHYMRLMADMRRAILERRFREFRNDFMAAQQAEDDGMHPRD